MSSAIAYQIKTGVSMGEVARLYGLEVDRRGFARCPFHAEKSSSFKVYDGDRGFHCFGCGATGDVIDFVMRYFSVRYADALSKLNNDFGLGLPTGRAPSPSERQRMAEIARRRAFERERIAKAITAAEAAYWAEFDRWLWLERCAADYKPQSPSDEINSLFEQAMKELPAQRDALKRAEFARWKARCRATTLPQVS